MGIAKASIRTRFNRGIESDAGAFRAGGGATITAAETNFTQTAES
jgi:hypothetical protein